MTNTMISTAETICKKLKIEVKPVNTKEELVKSKNFSATILSERKIYVMK